MDKKLTGWSHLKRWLIAGSKSKLGPVTNDIPQGSVSGPALFNISLAMCQCNQGTLSKFVNNTKVCGVVTCWRQRDAPPEGPWQA